MTTVPKPATLPADVIREDRRLEQAITTSQTRAKTATLERDRLRWEWTTCPQGPQLTHEAYGTAVDRARNTITTSVNAYVALIEKSAPDLSITCAYGEPHDLVAQDLPQTEPVTEEDAQDHAETKRKVTLGEVRALIVREIALRWRVAESTVDNNTPYTPHKREILARVQAETDLDDPNLENTVANITLDYWRDWKLGEDRVRWVRKWMASNRAVEVADVSDKDARSMVARIHTLMDRKDLDWETAETERRGWDWKRCEAERISNEFERKARKAVLDLRKAAADLRAASNALIKAKRAIEADDIPLTDDEALMVENDLDYAATAIGLARASLTGNSGTDWDAALASMTDRK